MYKNDLDKTIYSGKYYSETNVPEVTDAANLLLKIFDKVTTTNLINNTTNYNKMLKGTLSLKVFRTPKMLKGAGMDASYAELAAQIGADIFGDI